MRNAENIEALLQLKPDFIGFIFYDKSKRFMTEVLPEIDFGTTLKTGVFVNESLDKILKTADNYRLDVIQLHGQESPEVCQKIQDAGYKVIKVFSVGNTFDFKICKAYSAFTDWFLFDTKGSFPGGNGIGFNWEILKDYKLEKTFLLSGGISLADLETIKIFKHPKLAGVDVNSGFEISPGYKNINELKTFFNEIRS